MKFEFQIKNKIIETKNTNTSKNDSLICIFSFLTEEWKYKEKYLILWDNKNQTTIISLGKKTTIEYEIPKEIAKQNNFTIQIYIDNKIKTQKLNISLSPSSKNNTAKKKINKCKSKEKEDYNDYDIIKILNEILTRLESKVTSIKYENGYLKCFADKTLIYSEPVFSDIYDDIEKIVKEINSQIQWSGDYNDLKNIPTEFTPKHHTHIMVDVIDYEENIDTDLNTLLDFLTDEINKE